MCIKAGVSRLLKNPGSETGKSGKSGKLQGATKLYAFPQINIDLLGLSH